MLASFKKIFNKYNTSSDIQQKLINYQKTLHINIRTSFSRFCNDYMERPYNIEMLISDYEEYRKLGRGVKKEKMILKYGPVEGTSRWNSYCDQQAETNSLEYKKSKYNWTDEDFIAYNKQRSVTLSNLQKRHGVELGEEKWKNYIEKQRDAGCSLKYFKGKYGEEIGTAQYLAINNKKRLTLDNFVSLYGEIEGAKRYIEVCERRSIKLGFSKNSQDLFSEVFSKCYSSNKVYFASLNNEYYFNHKNFPQCYFVDYYDLSQNKIIEFYGDYYHCNPQKYNSDYYHTKLKMNASDIWIKNEERINNIKNYYGCEILIIWENEYTMQRTETITKCIKFLNYEY